MCAHLSMYAFMYHKNTSNLISRLYAFKCSSAYVGVCVCMFECVCVRVYNLTVYAVKLELIKGSVKQRECNYQT